MIKCKNIITLCDENFNSCGDLGVNINNILTTEISDVKTIEGFNKVLYSELIDVKSRKTISSYPLLRVLYDRYKSSFNGSRKSSSFDYYKMDNFVTLVGDYWVDLIEQVIPSTTIWGSTIKYRNNIFDKTKFKYKQYTLFTCQPVDKISYPSPTSGNNKTIEVITTNISKSNKTNICLDDSTDSTTCSGVTIQQINFGSEFIGSVTVIGNPVISQPPIISGNTNSGTTVPILTTPNPTGTTSSGPIRIVECDLIINSIKINIPDDSTGTVTPSFVGGTAPYKYKWLITKKEGQFSDWDFQNGNNTTQVALLTGTTTTGRDAKDIICFSLEIEDINGCTYTIKNCYPK